MAPNGRRLTLFTHTRDNGTGRVWIYELKSKQWVEIGKIIGQEGERFGQTAALSKAGGIIAVGASFANDKKGAVRIFNYLGGTVWEQMGSDIEGMFLFSALRFFPPLGIDLKIRLNPILITSSFLQATLSMASLVGTLLLLLMPIHQP